MSRWRRLACTSALLVTVGPGCQEEAAVTAPALSATCEARPASGPAPLVVSFLLGVSGAEGPFTVAVTYGDGSSGTNPDSPHTYTQAGAFTAAFTVATATQTARCSTAVSVQAGPSPPIANRPPEAVFKSTPDAVGGTIRGPAPLDVRFNMCASSDPEGDPLYFLMDFDGDGRFDRAGTTGAHCRADHRYAAGTWTARNCLHDTEGGGQALHDDQCRTYAVVAAP